MFNRNWEDQNKEKDEKESKKPAKVTKTPPRNPSPKKKVVVFDFVDIYSYAKKVEDFLTRVGKFQMFKAVRICADGRNRGSPGNAAIFETILTETKNVMAICRKGGAKE